MHCGTMKLRITDNLAKVEADLDRLAERIRTVAIPRALNALVPPVQREGFRQIATTYAIPARTMELYASQRLASPGNLQASITVKGRGFPMSLFKPVQTKEGVRVTIKGRRILIPHAFMVPRFGQHVFARGAYGSVPKPTGQHFGRFAFGKGRLPIHELWSFSPPSAFANELVTRAMDDEMQARAGRALERELGAVARGF